MLARKPYRRVDAARLVVAGDEALAAYEMGRCEDRAMPGLDGFDVEAADALVLVTLEVVIAGSV